MNHEPTPSDCGSQRLAAGEQTIAHVRGLIERGALRPGDRLAPERELVRQIGVSRTSVQEGLRSLAAMGVVRTRKRSGVYITSGPPTLASEPVVLLAAIHGVGRGRLFEVRRALEGSTAALAAERATENQLAVMADAVAGMSATLADPQAFLHYDIRFHRAVATGANNLVLGALVEMVASLFYEQRRATIERAQDSLREGADMHRGIYRAIRSRDANRARAAMDEHLCLVQASHLPEDVPHPSGQPFR